MHAVGYVCMQESKERKEQKRNRVQMKKKEAGRKKKREVDA